MKLTLLSFFIFLNCFAKSTLQSANFSFGSHTEFFRKIQMSEKGDVNNFTFSPTLGIGAELKSDKNYYLYPEFILVWPDSGEYEKLTKTIMFFRFDLGKKFLKEKILTTIGTSLSMTYLKGSGGTITLPNGDNQSESFYAPNESRFSINNTLDLGIQYYLQKEYAVRLQTFTYSLFESEKRAVSYIVSINYYWDGILTMDWFR